MITRADAEDIAAGWAHGESVRRGVEHVPVVDEFDLGFVVASNPVERQPGAAPDGGTTVIDRETGRLSYWPRVPNAEVHRMYREHRDTIVGPPKTADAEVELRRNAHRRSTPNTAAHITLNGRLIIARGAKGDQEFSYHPLIADRLAAIAHGHKVRGAERHAEILVTSDALHEADHTRAAEGLAPLTVDQARELLGTAHLETFQIREPGDPLGGRPVTPCETCIEVLTQLSLIPRAATGALFERIPPAQPNPVPDRFPDDIASALLDAHWRPQRKPNVAAGMVAVMTADIVAVEGKEHRHEGFPAASAALESITLLTAGRCGPGIDQRIRYFTIDPRDAMHSADVLYEFGQVIGARLFPIGAEAETSFLTVDERGRVFALDQGGEWFIAETFDQALITLLTGGFTPRVRDDGTW
ncbi:SUKH-3 domain-containing protein [Actinoplanes sp. NPDC051494]|uniref:SUKH-3 domain-containing protein n=1 Tax=Actinoplanes sp. NPDC051494 TaxID=3363907 RepID=UPI0037A5FE4E